MGNSKRNRTQVIFLATGLSDADRMREEISNVVDGIEIVNTCRSSRVVVMQMGRGVYAIYPLKCTIEQYKPNKEVLGIGVREDGVILSRIKDCDLINVSVHYQEPEFLKNSGL